jgi:hypothetical protein
LLKKYIFYNFITLEFWKLFKDIALGTAKYSTIEEDPGKLEDIASNWSRFVAFYLGILAAGGLMAYILTFSFQNHVLDRFLSSYEVHHMSSIPFPNIYVCNNYDPSVNSSGYPKDRGCTVSVVQRFPGTKRPCISPYVRKDIRVFNIRCLLYSNQTALSKAYTLRIIVDFGNGTSVTTPWAGGFLFLRDPKYGDDIDEAAFSSSRWYILSSNAYYLFHLELVLRSKNKDFEVEEEDRNALADYDRTQSPDSAPLAIDRQWLNGSSSNIIVDFVFRTFTIKHNHEYRLRTLVDLAVDMGGAISVVTSTAFIFGQLLAYFVKCLCKRRRNPRHETYEMANLA